MEQQSEDTTGITKPLDHDHSGKTDVLTSKETLGGDHTDTTEENTAVHHTATTETISCLHDADTCPEESSSDHVEDMRAEETLEVHAGDTGPEETSGDHVEDTRAEETLEVHHRDTSPEETSGDHLEDTSPEETPEVHAGDTGPEETGEPLHGDTNPGETPGAHSGDAPEGESNESSGNAEPEDTLTSTGEGERAAGGEEEEGVGTKSEKVEGENRDLMGASGDEEEAIEEEESGEKGASEQDGSHTPATQETMDEHHSPAGKEEEVIEAETPPDKQAVSSESSTEDGSPSTVTAEEGACGGGAPQPDGDSQGSAAGVESSAPSGGAVETEKPPAPETKKPLEKKRDITRSRTVPKSYGGQSRKAIMEKFGGPAAGATPNFKVQRSTSFGASSVKNMLLDWCRAKTRDYEHVDIQNFSSSWSSGMAFCALVHKFFPESFDYATLDPKNRRQNFELAFSTAEKHADCAQLLEVDDMVRMRVPDSKCVYTYVQELYRSLVQMGLVKTKKQ